MMGNPYRTSVASTVGAEESVALIYDGVRRFVDLALEALEQQRWEEVGHYAGRAQRVLSELMLTLDMAVPMSTDLAKLYEYWIWRLSQGVVNKEPGAFREVSTVLGDMREAWAEAARSVRAQRPAMHHG